MFRRRMTRVDIQVSILSAVLVTLSCGIIYMMNYTMTYDSMIKSLQERVLVIYDYLEMNLQNVTFEDLNNPEDKDKDVYIRTKALLENVKDITDVRYLYTAKQASDGSYVYLIDGLPSDSHDFRYIGDPIEEEIIPDIEAAYLGKQVFPKAIKDTSWGYIFISYLPIYSGDEIIGVLGIEFDAGNQYITFRILRRITPLVIVVFCFIAMFFATRLFRRISNPTFQDLANTDMLTGLKNRNAFETDIHNLTGMSDLSGIAFLSIDLDRLKHVNDTWGHQAGDRYIKAGSSLIHKNIEPYHVLYRIGGDEFVVVVRDGEPDKLKRMIDTIQAGSVREIAEIDGEPYPKLSAGYAVYDSRLDRDLEDTLKRADDAMYENKKERRKAG